MRRMTVYTAIKEAVLMHWYAPEGLLWEDIRLMLKMRTVMNRYWAEKQKLSS